MPQFNSSFSPVYDITPETVAHVRNETQQLRPNSRNITVFAAGGYPKNEQLTDDALRLGELIGQAGHNLVWGGSGYGMMGEVALGARAAGALLIGVAYGSGGHSLDYMFDAINLRQRKVGLMALGDVAITMPGGIGTFDEFGTYLERKKAGVRTPPLVVLNSCGFYNGMRKQFDRIGQDGFSTTPLDQLVHFADTPEQAVELASTLQAPPPPAPKKK
jgi:uncharacterized protein (TIGR00730 family)